MPDDRPWAVKLGVAINALLCFIVTHSTSPPGNPVSVEHHLPRSSSERYYQFLFLLIIIWLWLTLLYRSFFFFKFIPFLGLFPGWPHVCRGCNKCMFFKPSSNFSHSPHIGFVRKLRELQTLHGHPLDGQGEVLAFLAEVRFLSNSSAALDRKSSQQLFNFRKKSNWRSISSGYSKGPVNWTFLWLIWVYGRLLYLGIMYRPMVFQIGHGPFFSAWTKKKLGLSCVFFKWLSNRLIALNSYFKYITNLASYIPRARVCVEYCKAMHKSHG